MKDELKENQCEYIGSKQAAEMLGWNQDRVSRWCREKRFKTADQDKKGSPWRIHIDEVEKLLKVLKRR